MTIGFREFANNSFNIWSDSGIYNIKTTVYTVPSPNPTPTSVPSTTSPIPTEVPSQNPTVTPNITSTPSSTILYQKTFSNEMIFIIIASFTAILFFILIFSFKRGYIKVEVVDERNNETKTDYQI